MKDLDIIKDDRKLHLGTKKTAFMAQLRRDAMFLAQLNIMDYSLLVGIHDRRQRKVAGPRASGNGDESVIMGPSGQHSNTPFRRRRSSVPEQLDSPHDSPTAIDSRKRHSGLGLGHGVSGNPTGVKSPSPAASAAPSPVMAAAGRKRLNSASTDPADKSDAVRAADGPVVELRS